MGYDTVGNRILLVDPNSGRYTYSYDPNQRSLVTVNARARRVTNQYDPVGNRSVLELPLGGRREYQYDGLNRLTSQIEKNALGQPIVTMSDDYDRVSNRAWRNQDGQVTTWNYDAINRLTGQQAAAAWATFVYDSVGNILVKHEQGSAPRTMSYDVGNRLIAVAQGAGITTVTSDANGNMSEENLGGQLTSYIYDPENRLIRVLKPDATRATYVYAGGFPVEGEGLRRMAWEPGGSPTTFVWDGADYLQERR